MKHHKLMVSTGTNKLKHHRPQKCPNFVSGAFHNFSQNFLSDPKLRNIGDESNEIYAHLLDMEL
jgi:hypothetical protein